MDGQVSQHLSPFEQKIVGPLFKDVPLKVFKRVKDFVSEAGLGLGLGIIVFYWGDAKHKELAFHHRA
ncbi:cytochrome b-c1 complex subunit 8 [archaeon]|nr:MAG: cytochrome b-c1 complex subunit 8 [archaeon]